MSDDPRPHIDLCETLVRYGVPLERVVEAATEVERHARNEQLAEMIRDQRRSIRFTNAMTLLVTVSLICFVLTMAVRL